MSILRKPLAAITADDIEELCRSNALETAELEFKGSLPFRQQKGQQETEDRWITRGDRVGDYARDQLLSELVAFANADGGTLVLGVHETDEQPRRAERLARLPRCEDLARRLVDACEDVIEPRLPMIDGRGIPAGEDGEGYVVLRVGRSASGPHRLAGDGQFYIRRGERSAKMTVREIRESVLELARRGDAVEAIMERHVARHRESFDRLLREAPDPERAHAIEISMMAFPATRWSIPDLTSRQQLWWKGRPFNIAVQDGEHRVNYPAREFDSNPDIRLRALYQGGKDDHFERALTAEAQIEFAVRGCEMPGHGRLFGDTRPLYWDWVISLLAGTLAQVDHLRTTLANDGAQFGLQMLISSNLELSPSWGDRIGLGRGGQFHYQVFPALPVGGHETFDEVVNWAMRDIRNHCGSSRHEDIRVNWPDLLTPKDVEQV